MALHAHACRPKLTFRNGSLHPNLTDPFDQSCSSGTVLNSLSDSGNSYLHPDLAEITSRDNEALVRRFWEGKLAAQLFLLAPLRTLAEPAQDGDAGAIQDSTRKRMELSRVAAGHKKLNYVAPIISTLAGSPAPLCF